MSYCIQWFQRTLNLLNTEVRSLGHTSSSQGPPGEIADCWALQPFPTFLWGHLPVSSGETCPCTQGTVPLLPPLPLSWVQLTAWDRAVHLLLSWKERTGKLPDKLLDLCRWTKTFSRHSVRILASPTLLPLDLVALLLISKYCWNNKILSLWRSIPPQRATCASGLVLRCTPADQTGCPLTAALLIMQGRAEVSHGLPGQGPKQMLRSACRHFNLERALNLRMLCPCRAPFGFGNNF